MQSVPRKGYVVVGAGLALNLVLGVLYSWSIIAKALTTQWSWTASEASLPYAIAVGAFALSMMFAGRLQDSLGPRIVAAIGGVLCGAGLVISSFGTQSNTLPVIVGFGLFSGVGIGFGYAAATPAAIKWFGQARKGLVTGVVVSGFGLASIYIAPLTTYLISSAGIDGAFRILGIAFLVFAILASLFLVNPPKGYSAPLPTKKVASPPSPRADGAEETRERNAATGADSAVVDRSWKEMLATPRFYLMWLAYACATFAGLMIIGHMAKIASVQITGADLGFLLVAALAVGNASGRLLAGILLDKIGAVTTMLIVFIGQAAAMLVLGFVASLPVLVIVAMLVGAFYGANLAIFPAASAGFFGTKNMGVNYGILFTAYGVGGVFGSLVAGRIFDSTGSYQIAFYLAAALCVVAAVLAPFAGRPSKQR